ncbi:metal-dependent transcriptional regulator [Herbiconiux sp. KACC 21604]|uniref:metal-dependent transcriptional regulator n=1 Tax=unclassified Herbiconiux TaxID=2618217 RepID=UPI001493087C|nr:metal-dependent transcriptional regulator [Herbiconiux sp. SALV-R1]QJU55266.1 metal-dependent transcriptional regulator [Herbiconiux sp. SALV-R1]WPO86433.1 metal-dependent transcriptional regulator [Herbiconiux sp. KACC 21604]
MTPPAAPRPAGQDTAAENYLKTIYAHTEWQPDPITPSALAGRLGVAPSSVTEMVKKLAAAGLITHVPYGPLTLTPEGRMRAMGVVRRHRLTETWLVREMGYEWHEVHDEAEVLEHALSERLLDAIDERLGRPAQDPHGDPIPSAAGTVASYSAVLLSQAAVGHRGVVLRISDRDPSLLKTLAARGITPGVAVRVEPGGALSVEGGGGAGGGAGAGALGSGASSGDGQPVSVDADAIWLTA